MRASKNVLICGVTSKIGYQLAWRHCEMGDQVYGLDAMKLESLKELTEQYPNLRVFKCDVRYNIAVDQALSLLTTNFEKVNIIYYAENNIIESQRGLALAELDVDGAKKMMDINAFGMLRLCKGLWDKIWEDSLVVAISDYAGSIGAARQGDSYGYAMSKAALNMATKLLSNELWQRNARAICIAPGPVRPEGLLIPVEGPTIKVEESVAGIFDIVEKIQEIPRDQLFVDYQGHVLAW